MYSRDEFEKLRLQAALGMASDTSLQQKALEVFTLADRHMWVHQATWFGEPVLQVPHDMFALQEIIFKTRPKYIIELGVCWGGSLLFYSTLMEILGGEKIIGVDVYIPEDLKERLYAHRQLSSRIELIQASSIEKSTIEKVKEMTKGSREVMILLDSNHTHDHVLEELRLYSPFVGKGYYMICGDTIVEKIDRQTHRERPWGPGNNPMTALKAFLNESNRFSKDTALMNKLLFTCNPEGYLVCIKD
ncbi:MAG: Cephalosporin hydroxylase [uncultured bacterium]|nr:MAG: Cephalosporin hydroxylase [uncultured bacterium]